MDKVRWFSVLLGLGAFVVLAAVTHVLGHLYAGSTGLGGMGSRSANTSGLLGVFVGEQLNPWSGGLLGDLVRFRGVLSWLLGLATAVLVLALVLVSTARRRAPGATFAGGWLGTILGTAAGGLVAVVAMMAGLPGPGWFEVAWSREVLFAVMRGLYWGAAAGWLVGAAAALGAADRTTGSRGATTRVGTLDSPPPPAR